MYNRSVFCLSSVAIRDNDGCSGNSVFATLAAREIEGGLQVKNYKGDSMRLRRISPQADHHCLLHCRQLVHSNPEATATFTIDEPYAERLTTYVQEYYGKKRTNCAAFAGYMRTGVFEECSAERENIVFPGGMNAFTGQRIRTGDTLAILYYKKFARSRRLPEFRRHYRQNQKHALEDLSKLETRRVTVTGDEFLEQYLSGIYADYHFMFCVDQYRGRPVFVQQMGRHHPGEPLSAERASIVATIGMTNMSHSYVPAAMLIKRGRN